MPRTTSQRNSRNDGTPAIADVVQPVTDDSIRVRQVTHYQFSWIAQEPSEEGVWTLQLVMDHGAWEEVVTVDNDDADVLESLLRRAGDAHYDVGRRVLMFGSRKVGA
jgi:hypothetical protein